MQHDRLTGKLNMKSKEVIRDPGSVKRLLEAAMIYPDGKLTPEARKKCAALSGKLQNHRTLSSADSKRPGGDKPAALPGKKPGQVSVAHWAVLMKYDRKTGNLLRIDPKTGRLDKISRLILKNPSIIQHLIEKNLILPGGWLTPEAKKSCGRIEEKIKAQAQGHRSVREDRSRRKSKNEQNSKIHSGRRSKTDRAYDWQADKDLQAFFESLPAEGPGPDPRLFFAYDWQDERDLQAYFEKLPLEFLNPATGARLRREPAPHPVRGAANSRRDAGSKKQKVKGSSLKARDKGKRIKSLQAIRPESLKAAKRRKKFKHESTK